MEPTIKAGRKDYTRGEETKDSRKSQNIHRYWLIYPSVDQQGTQKSKDTVSKKGFGVLGGRMPRMGYRSQDVWQKESAAMDPSSLPSRSFIAWHCNIIARPSAEHYCSCAYKTDNNSQLRGATEDACPAGKAARKRDSISSTLHSYCIGRLLARTRVMAWSGARYLGGSVCVPRREKERESWKKGTEN